MFIQLSVSLSCLTYRAGESERSIKRMIHSIADKFHSPDVINQSQLEWRGHAREKPSFILRVSPGPYLSLQTFPHTRKGAFFINGSLFLLNWRKNRTPEFTRSLQRHKRPNLPAHTQPHLSENRNQTKIKFPYQKVSWIFVKAQCVFSLFSIISWSTTYNEISAYFDTIKVGWIEVK